MSSVGYGFSEYESVKYWMFWDGDVSETIRKTIENQQPIHFEALCRILAPIWGNQKATNVIRREVNYYFRWHLNEIVKVDGDFVSLVGFVVLIKSLANWKLPSVLDIFIPSTFLCPLCIQ